MSILSSPMIVRMPRLPFSQKGISALIDSPEHESASVTSISCDSGYNSSFYSTGCRIESNRQADSRAYVAAFHRDESIPVMLFTMFAQLLISLMTA